MNSPARLYALLDITARLRLDTVADLAKRDRHVRTGAASIATQCLNTLRGDLCDGTLDPADVDWRAFATRPHAPREMLHFTDPNDDLAIVAARLGARVDRAFVNAIVGWAVERYLPEIDTALRQAA